MSSAGRLPRSSGSATSPAERSGASPSRAPLVVRTTEIDADVAGTLVELLPREGALSWVRRGEGLVGWGSVATLRPTGADRFARASAWWEELTAHAAVRDEVGVPGSGLLAFGSFAFADDPGDSVLVVPEVVVGRRGDRAWLTTVSATGLDRLDARGALVVPEPVQAPQEVAFADGALDGEAWMSAVAAAVLRIGDASDEGERLEKVVLARDLLASLPGPLDVRWPLSRLAASYPMCWTFHVDGLFGATPEMLVRRERGLVTSRVLAGTIRRSGDDQRDLALSARLARSSKDLEEHEYAVRSVADALAPYCSSMNVPDAPFVLHLPNVMHLASDVAGVAVDGASSLQLAEALHPSAAVGGTPTDLATRVIAEVEGMDRGRYAGPVGWVDGDGDGEWGIALRSAQVVTNTDHGSTVRLFAGCGIVADSDPEAELSEAQAKFVPVRDALTR